MTDPDAVAPPSPTVKRAVTVAPPADIGPPLRKAPWTPEQSAKLRQMRAAGYTWRQIAAALGRSVASCRAYEVNSHGRGQPPLPLAPPRRGLLSRLRAAWLAILGR